MPPARAAWCTPAGANGPATSVQGANAWLDDFEHGLTNAPMAADYQVFDRQESVYKTQHIRHNNHWMMDLAPRSPEGDGLLGGGMLRPNRAFRFEQGKLVVETEVAAGMEAYGAGADIWPEIVVTNAPAPTGDIPDSLYAYGQFGGSWSFGCRLQPTREPVCALYDKARTNYEGNGLFGTSAGRVWEMSNFQQVGTSVYGGEPGPAGGARDRAWRTCRSTDPDLNCRDRFRLELTKTSVSLYVNGTLYFEQRGLRVPFPDAFVNNPVYVYFAGWEARQTAEVIRFHWDRIAVNPDTLIAPTTTPTATPTATPTPTPTPTATPTASPPAVAPPVEPNTDPIPNGPPDTAVSEWDARPLAPHRLHAQA